MANILLATGDTRLYDVLSAEIMAEGHTIIWVADGQQAYEQTLTGDPGLVLLDLNLPVFNALELCGMLRGDPGVPPALPVFLLTDEDIEVHRLEKSRATGLFPKTHGVHELRDLLAAQIKPEAMP